jgi:hypothetical protein
MRPDRRRVLKAGAVAGSLFLPLPYAWVWAQSEGTLKLLKAPKVALVVGNGKYKDAPELKNAPNDAKGMSEALRASGFAVSTLVDTGRGALIQAIRDYVNGMEKQKAVGLFYFAGHGVQLDWRNYMLPIDAVIDKVEDVAKQSVDVARLMEGLTKAANPMNVIILDACRENPFGSAKPVAQKGLSQMDAPPHTILAYATSPGNVASDGEGVNGLYTENLLRELKVPEAKIEDVFKRVRLGVRRKTNGAQIPWESTSLEEDFWFIPPKELKKISDDERERQFKAEQALWEKVQESMAPAPIEDYLRSYPSGNFSELAQLQLDIALKRQGEKKIQIISAEGNPFSKGTQTDDLNPKVGYTQTYRVMDAISKVETETRTQTIVKVTDTEIFWANGSVTDLLGNQRRNPRGATITGNQSEPLEYAIGKRWHTRYTVTGPQGGTQTWDLTHRITGRENITVPAGTFYAWVIETEGGFQGQKLAQAVQLRRWKAPDKVRGPIVRDEVRRHSRGISFAERMELVSYKQP